VKCWSSIGAASLSPSRWGSKWVCRPQTVQCLTATRPNTAFFHSQYGPTSSCADICASCLPPHPRKRTWESCSCSTTQTRATSWLWVALVSLKRDATRKVVILPAWVKCCTLRISSGCLKPACQPWSRRKCWLDWTAHLPRGWCSRIHSLHSHPGLKVTSHHLDYFLLCSPLSHWLHSRALIRQCQSPWRSLPSLIAWLPSRFTTWCLGLLSRMTTVGYNASVIGLWSLWFKFVLHSCTLLGRPIFLWTLLLYVRCHHSQSQQYLGQDPLVHLNLQSFLTIDSLHLLRLNDLLL